MKLASVVALLALVGASSAAVVATQGCGSSEESTSSATPGTPPGKPSAGATTSTEEMNFAVSEVLIGDHARGSAGQDRDAWKKFGFNIDGKSTTSTSEDGCKLVGAAAKATRQDGENGIDNSFGANILPIILNAAATAPEVMNNALKNGAFTLMVDVTGLSGENNQSATGLSGFIVAGADLGKPPTFTTADDWPVRPETLSNKTDPKSSTIRLDGAYINNGTYVFQGDVRVNLVFGGTDLTLDLKKAALTFDRRGTKLENGMLGGVVKTSQLVEELRKIAGRFSDSLCGSGADGLITQIKEASDIMSDGTAGSPGAECDAVSLGLGFSAAQIGLPSKVGPAADPGADPCVGDGGT